MSLLPLLASFGCDTLTVRSFAGTVGEFTIDGVNGQTIAPTQHLELWARTQYDDIVRLAGYYDLGAGATAFGLMIRPAISLNDPCMIDAYVPGSRVKNGNLLTSPDAYQTSNAGGVTQSPAEQAQQVIDRIHQVTDNPTITTGGPLLAVLPYNAKIPPTIPANATPDQRKAACDAYTDNQKDPTAYVPNPFQLTAPLNGIVYGFVKFQSTKPPTNYDGYRIDMPDNLTGAREIFMTVEGDNVDPKNRGPLFMTSTMTQGGRDVVHFDLTHADPKGTATGTAALLVDLDQDPVQF